MTTHTTETQPLPANALPADGPLEDSGALSASAQKAARSHYVLAHHAYRRLADQPPADTTPTDTTAPASSRAAPSASADASLGGQRFMELYVAEPPAPAPPITDLRHLIRHAAQAAAELLRDDRVPSCDPVTDAVALAAQFGPSLQRTHDTAYRLGMDPADYRSLLEAHERPTRGEHAS